MPANEMTGGEALARMIKAHEGGPMFGMGGFQLLPFYDAARRLSLAHHLINDERAAVFAAGKRGCSTFIVPLGPSDRDLLALLRSIGRVRVQDDHARVDLGDYARMQPHSNSRI